MSEHRWGEPDKDGVRSCLRGGCTVRRTDNCWQRRKGAHWSTEFPTYGKPNPIPACTGTYAPEATLTRRCTTCGVPFDGPASATLFHCHRCAQTCGQCAPGATPSPLEVVRKALEPFAHYAMRRAEFPLRRLGDVIHGIHVGIPDEEAKITVTDCNAARDALAALATLEESIRAEERAKVLRELADEQRHAAECVRETFPERARWHDATATGYEGEADNIRARGKR